MTDFNLDQLGNPNAMMAGAAALTQDASSYTNTQDVEGTFVFYEKINISTNYHYAKRSQV